MIHPSTAKSTSARAVARITDWLLILSCIGFATGVWACGPLPRTTQIQVKDYRVSVELAISQEEKACGLSFRETLPNDHGMLFVFSSDRVLTFWMKDTLIPLSIAFLDADGVVLNTMEMEPLDLTPRYRSARPARYALEMPANWFAERQILPGDRFQLHLPDLSRR